MTYELSIRFIWSFIGVLEEVLYSTMQNPLFRSLIVLFEDEDDQTVAIITNFFMQIILRRKMTLHRTQSIFCKKCGFRFLLTLYIEKQLHLPESIISQSFGKSQFYYPTLYVTLVINHTWRCSLLRDISVVISI